MLFGIWTNVRHRATHDIDLLSSGSPELERLSTLFRSVCVIPVENDGVIFDPNSVNASRIRAEEEYEGVRINLKVFWDPLELVFKWILALVMRLRL